MLIQRGDGVGIELAHDVIRAVRLSHDESGTAAAAEVPLRSLDADEQLLDALVRVRAELGNPRMPTRIAIFPSGSTMFRLDVTGRNGPELNTLRAQVERTCGATSTVLVDSGPRRWMHVLQWSDPDLRRLEDLAERAGFVDVAIEPSPLALARVCAGDVTSAERSATTGETFLVAIDQRTPVAAATIEAVGTTPPQLVTSDAGISVALFDELTDPSDIARQLVEARDLMTVRETDLRLQDMQYPRFPPHDLRAPDRQCVALGAAVGAAGLSGRLRPIDVVTSGATSAGDQPLPWAIERVSSLPPLKSPTAPGAARRFTSRLLPRRRK